MANNSNNKLMDRLDTLDAMPGETPFVKEAAWDKLYARLDERPRRKKLLWYPAAAAFLLLVCIPLLVVKKHTIKNIERPLTQQPPAPSATSKMLVKKSPANVSVERPVNLPLKPAPTNTSKRPNKRELTLLTKEKQQADTMARSAGTDNLIITLPLQEETVAAEPAVIPARKKLPVVHINELGKQEQENLRFASHSQHNFFRLKLLNTQPGGAMPAAATGQELFKTTIPLKN